MYAVFEINCFTFEGINSIIAALEEGEKLSTEEIPLQIRLISSPRYSISTITKVPEAAIESIKKALEAVEKKIKELKGHFIVTENAVLVEEEESEEQEESESEE